MNTFSTHSVPMVYLEPEITNISLRTLKALGWFRGIVQQSKNFMDGCYPEKIIDPRICTFLK